MKLEELKNIIYEVTKKVFQEEIRDILVEAVQIASTPTESKSEKYFQNSENELEDSIEDKERGYSLSDILKETAVSMSKESKPEVFSSYSEDSVASVKSSSLISEVSSGAPMNEELPPFAMNAKAILDASVIKDKQRCRTELGK